jgi:hypothetical protein
MNGGCKTTDCSKTGLETAVDQENWLKNFAVYAVTITIDSPLGNGNNYFLAKSGDGKGWKIVQYDHNGAFQQEDSLCPCTNDPLQWAITRPSCAASKYTQLVGPLLKDTSRFNRYIEHVRTFINTVFTNTSLLAEMKAHAAAIKSSVRADPYSFGNDYSREVSGTPWPEGAKTGTLLGFLKQRAAIVKEQLQALDAGSFPRMPDKVQDWETCQDWRSTKPPEKKAPQQFTDPSEQMIIDGTAGCSAALQDCQQAMTCFNHKVGCISGKFVWDECKPAAVCAPCFPKSLCGTLKPTPPNPQSMEQWNQTSSALKTGVKTWAPVAIVSATIAMDIFH